MYTHIVEGARDFLRCYYLLYLYFYCHIMPSPTMSRITTQYYYYLPKNKKEGKESKEGISPHSYI